MTKREMSYISDQLAYLSNSVLKLIVENPKEVSELAANELLVRKATSR